MSLPSWNPKNFSGEVIWLCAMAANASAVRTCARECSHRTSVFDPLTIAANVIPCNRTARRAPAPARSPGVHRPVRPSLRLARVAVSGALGRARRGARISHIEIRGARLGLPVPDRCRSRGRRYLDRRAPRRPAVHEFRIGRRSSRAEPGVRSRRGFRGAQRADGPARSRAGVRSAGRGDARTRGRSMGPLLGGGLHLHRARRGIADARLCIVRPFARHRISGRPRWFSPFCLEPVTSAIVARKSSASSTPSWRAWCSPSASGGAARCGGPSAAISRGIGARHSSTACPTAAAWRPTISSAAIRPGPDWLSGGTVGPEGSVLATLVLLLLAAVVGYTTPRHPAAGLGRLPVVAVPDPKPPESA